MRQMIYIMVMFIFGSSVIMGVNSTAAQDSWASLLLGMAFACPVLLVYARIIRLFPEKDLFAIIEILFGKIAGKIIILLMVWYAIHLGALVLRNFSEFIEIALMPETPQLPIAIAMILVVSYMAKSGIKTMGKWSIVMLPAIVLVLIITLLFSLNKMDFENILPFLEHDFGTISTGAFQLFSYPYAESVLFLCLAGAIRKNDNPYKLNIYALVISTAILLLVLLRNLFILGPAMVGSSYFPSFVAVRVIKVADYLTRMEGFIAMNFILAGIIKITVCLMAAAKGASALFGIRNHKQLVLPVSLLIVALSAIIYKNAMEMFNFIPIYKYYAAPFQIIIPLIIWIAAEIKTRKRRSAYAQEEPLAE